MNLILRMNLRKTSTPMWWGAEDEQRVSTEEVSSPVHLCELRVQ